MRVESGMKITLSKMSFQYPNNGKLIYQNTNAVFTDGFYYLNGLSGTGKTTLLQLIAGWLKPTNGKVIFYDQINKKKLVIGGQKNDIKDLKHFRKQTGIIFQDFKLDDEISVYDNVFSFLKMRQKKITNKQLQTASQYLKALGFENVSKLKKKKVSELSGGQKQKIAIIRALMTQPRIVLADEVTSNLGTAETYKVTEMLSKYAKDRHAIVIFSTHDSRLTAKKKHDFYLINNINHKLDKYKIKDEGYKQSKSILN